MKDWGQYQKTYQSSWSSSFSSPCWCCLTDVSPCHLSLLGCRFTACWSCSKLIWTLFSSLLASLLLLSLSSVLLVDASFEVIPSFAWLASLSECCRLLFPPWLGLWESLCVLLLLLLILSGFDKVWGSEEVNKFCISLARSVCLFRQAASASGLGW